MNNSIFNFSKPENEKVKQYEPESGERCGVIEELENLSSKITEIPVIIDNKEVFTGNIINIYAPHDNKKIIAKCHLAGENEIKKAIESSKVAHSKWETMSWIDRVTITLKIAELISGKYRNLVNASTMLGQSKSVYQAEIDAACETIDFIRFNAYYLSQIYNSQPLSSKDAINRIEYRPLEGFVYAVSPFNFTSISANLCLSPALVGNTILWKPATSSLLSNYILMKIFIEAGLPEGVINFLPSEGKIISNIVLNDKNFAGLHFTGSTETFNHLWKQISHNIGYYKSYPRIVGETGGKDFVLVHNSANTDEVSTALIRGSFEYQGQKCSASSRAYIPKSLWKEIERKLGLMISQIKIGNVTNFENFMNAVIDGKAYNRIVEYIEYAKKSNEAEVILGGNYSDDTGYFIEPTIIITENPKFKTMEEEIFGPVLTIYIYEDNSFENVLDLIDSTSPYALTGAIFSKNREVLEIAYKKLRYAAGNLYFNDKPTGAVVGQQPFGGSRASGTNDKAGSFINLMRWVSPRTIKETLVPPTDFKYPFMKIGKC